MPAFLKQYSQHSKQSGPHALAHALWCDDEGPLYICPNLPCCLLLCQALCFPVARSITLQFDFGTVQATPETKLERDRASDRKAAAELKARVKAGDARGLVGGSTAE
jgi:hypothetical protein